MSLAPRPVDHPCAVVVALGATLACCAMHIFFDTEFTQFREGELLSIGFVSDDDDELVIEVHDPARLTRASQFCRNLVIPQFGCTPACRVTTDIEVGNIVAGWLSRFHEPVMLLYDYKLDWRLLEHALIVSGTWARLNTRIAHFNVADVANLDACLAAQEDYFQGRHRPGRHHPLIDARALRVRWQTYLEQADIDRAA